MKGNYKFTIITICKNAGNTIARTIESVINQNYTNIEYIIVDGQSNDSTLDIIRSFDDTRIKLISERDNGISDAFNKGIRLATDELIGLINADDYLMPEAIKKIAEKYDGKADVVYGDTMVETKRIILQYEKKQMV